ncbi:hypothetical protein DL768_000850 [Monosporascus sp. mg162]|nr:hypothetical protein DL768_000850 [Monosporascus sp. mg162]
MRHHYCTPLASPGASLQQHLGSCYNTHVGQQIASCFEAVLAYTAAGCSGTPPAQPVFSTEINPRRTDEPRGNGNDDTGDNTNDNADQMPTMTPIALLHGQQGYLQVLLH